MGCDFFFFSTGLGKAAVSFVLRLRDGEEAGALFGGANHSAVLVRTTPLASLCLLLRPALIHSAPTLFPVARAHAEPRNEAVWLSRVTD